MIFGTPVEKIRYYENRAIAIRHRAHAMADQVAHFSMVGYCRQLRFHGDENRAWSNGKRFRYVGNLEA
jgi:hypothetical protein